MFTPYSSRKRDRKQRSSCRSFSRTSKVRANRCPAWSVNTWAAREIPFRSFQSLGTFWNIAVACCGFLMLLAGQQPSSCLIASELAVTPASEYPHRAVDWIWIIFNLPWIQYDAMHIARKKRLRSENAVHVKADAGVTEAKALDRHVHWIQVPAFQCIPMHSMPTWKIWSNSLLMSLCISVYVYMYNTYIHIYIYV